MQKEADFRVKNVGLFDFINCKLPYMPYPSLQLKNGKISFRLLHLLRLLHLCIFVNKINHYEFNNQFRK